MRTGVRHEGVFPHEWGCQADSFTAAPSRPLILRTPSLSTMFLLSLPALSEGSTTAKLMGTWDVVLFSWWSCFSWHTGALGYGGGEGTRSRESQTAKLTSYHSWNYQLLYILFLPLSPDTQTSCLRTIFLGNFIVCPPWSTFIPTEIYISVLKW